MIHTFSELQGLDPELAVQVVAFAKLHALTPVEALLSLARRGAGLDRPRVKPSHVRPIADLLVVRLRRFAPGRWPTHVTIHRGHQGEIVIGIHRKAPGPAKGQQILQLGERARWTEPDGSITLDSVERCLAGLPPRPVVNLSGES